MLHRVSQNMWSKVGLSDKTVDKDYKVTKEMTKALREATKLCSSRMSDMDKAMREVNTAIHNVSKALEKLLMEEYKDDYPANKQLTTVVNKLADAAEQVEKVVYPPFQKVIETDCNELLALYDAELKKTDELRDVRTKKRNTYDYYRNEFVSKGDELRKEGRDPSTSQSYLRKKQKFEETSFEYERANEEAKRGMRGNIDHKDSIMANLLQTYLRGCTAVFGEMHQLFTDLHSLTVPKPPRSPAASRGGTPPPASFSHSAPLPHMSHLNQQPTGSVDMEEALKKAVDSRLANHFNQSRHLKQMGKLKVTRNRCNNRKITHLYQTPILVPDPRI
ncbi:hypothetical protein DIPPA_34839 [Diplonema papillatum]|nr:hypothetical protein DIPPA_34839 [Diplonema papillatum]